MVSGWIFRNFAGAVRCADNCDRFWIEKSVKLSGIIHKTASVSFSKLKVMVAIYDLGYF
jgi:hypothetical protein